MRESGVGLLTFPIERSGVRPLSNLIGILSGLTRERIALVSGNAGRVFENDERVRFSGVDHAAGSNAISRILHNVVTQARVTRRIVEQDGTDTWIFFFGGEVLVLPMAAARLLGKKVVMALPGHTATMMAPAGDRLLLPARILTRATCRLCTRIVLYSPALVDHWGLERYREKIAIAHEHLLDFGVFRVEMPLNERPITVGYIGRLAEEKGVWNFVRALPRIAAGRRDVHIFIGGDGPLLPDLREFVRESGLTDRVTFAGWIPHEDLPRRLNGLRLLVLPSYTEGLPNIMLEAMVCGTPVLATPVGAVPDFIRDGETGFILASNTPEEIATSVLAVFGRPDLESVAQAAGDYVREEITVERATEQFASVIDGLGG
ncbi:D-inositol-3-phosphate glycosyltransferase [anaerobic digester metagenome]